MCFKFRRELTRSSYDLRNSRLPHRYVISDYIFIRLIATLDGSDDVLAVIDERPDEPIGFLIGDVFASLDTHLAEGIKPGNERGLD